MNKIKKTLFITSGHTNESCIKDNNYWFINMNQKHRAHVYPGYATACNISIKTRNTVTEECAITP